MDTQGRPSLRTEDVQSGGGITQVGECMDHVLEVRDNQLHSGRVEAVFSESMRFLKTVR